MIKKINVYPWKTMTLWLVVFGLLIGVGFVVMTRFTRVEPVSTTNSAPTFSEERRMTINGKLLKLELAQTTAEAQQGLSDRLSMNDDEGMLFYMGSVDIHAFWMNRMHFPLDMIWLKDGIVVEIAPNVPPPSETAGIPKTYVPSAKADMVLELTKGGVERYGLKVGDRIDI